MKAERYLDGVVTLEYDERKCTGCGMCTIVCPHGVYTMNSKKAQLVDRDACMECGACAKNCPEQALTVRAGVGCAYGIIMGKLKKSGSACDCCC